jgi:hypothetical protein
VNVYFTCPSCDYPGRATSIQDHWHCPQCDHLLSLEAELKPATPAEAGQVPERCRVCGNAELYKKKDFPHALGLTILALACITSTITYGLYDKWLTWTILIGSALFDGLLYLWVKDVIVCYRCNAHHRGVAPGSVVAPFELTVHERYRQERIRREQLQRESQQSAPHL